MGLSITDVCLLVAKGYKVDDLKNVNKMIEGKNEKECNSIIELAKKVSFNDLSAALSFASSEENKGADDTKDDSKDNQEKDDTKDKDSDSGSDDGTSDKSETHNEDYYKQLYEKEKKLREDLQAANQNKGGADGKQKSDEEMLLEITTDILN